MAICETCDYANRPPYKSPCSECDKTMGSPFCCYEHEEKPTNADRIRAMSDEELAKLIVENAYTGACNDFGIPHQGQCCHNCERCDAIIKWLKQPAE